MMTNLLRGSGVTPWQPRELQPRTKGDELDSRIRGSGGSAGANLAAGLFDSRDYSNIAIQALKEAEEAFAVGNPQLAAGRLANARFAYSCAKEEAPQRVYDLRDKIALLLNP